MTGAEGGNARLRRWALALAAAVVFGCAAGAGEAAASVGTLRVLQGEVSILRGAQIITVRQTATLEDGDKVQSQAATRAHIRLTPANGGGEALVQANTLVEVKDVTRPGKRAPFALALGSLRARVLQWTRLEPCAESPTAVVGIKGTDFIVWVKRPNATEFIGVDGLIECSSISRPDYSIRIGPRLWGEIVEGQKPAEPIEVPDDLWASVLQDYAYPEN